ncbi:MAG: DUF2892 domain-containing protein [Paracoccaceae bacterium]
MFKNNISLRDRVYRAAASAILISAYFSATDWAFRWVALYAGLYLLFTAIMSTCAIYSVIGYNGNSRSEDEATSES